MLVCHCIFSVTVNVHSHFRRFSGLHWLQVIFSLIATWCACLPLFFHYLQLGLAVCYCFFTNCNWTSPSATVSLQIATQHTYQWLFFTNCNLFACLLQFYHYLQLRCTCLPLFFHWLQLILLVCNSFLMSAARCACLPLYILHNCQCTLTFQAIEWFALIAGHLFH